MAPKSASKRGAKAAAGPVAKKPKTDANMVGVLDALRQAEALPSECRAMLEAGVPACLSTPADERHELQATLVSWIDKVFDAMQAKLEEAVEAAGKEVDSADAARGGLESQVSEAQAAADAKSEVVKGKGEELTAARQAVKEAKAKLSTAQAAQKTGDADLKKASDAKAKLEAVLAEHFGFLRREEGFDPKQAKDHMRKITPVAKQLKLDESLMTALPSASAQAPSKRGDFDVMVLDQLEAGIQGKIDEHSATLKAGEASAADRAAVVAAAQGELEEAEKAEGAASTALSGAKEEEAAAFATLNEANAALVAGATSRSAAQSAREDRAVALDNFKNYNLSCYKLLRDKAETEAAEKDAAAAEA